MSWESISWVPSCQRSHPDFCPFAWRCLSDDAWPPQEGGPQTLRLRLCYLEQLQRSGIYHKHNSAKLCSSNAAEIFFQIGTNFNRQAVQNVLVVPRWVFIQLNHRELANPRLNIPPKQICTIVETTISSGTTSVIFQWTQHLANKKFRTDNHEKEPLSRIWRCAKSHWRLRTICSVQRKRELWRTVLAWRQVKF